MFVNCTASRRVHCIFILFVLLRAALPPVSVQQLISSLSYLHWINWVIDLSWNLNRNFTATVVKMYALFRRFNRAMWVDLLITQIAPKFWAASWIYTGINTPHAICLTPTDWEEHMLVSLPHCWWPCALVSPGTWHICVFTSSLTSLNTQTHASVMFEYVFACLFLYICRPKHW